MLRAVPAPRSCACSVACTGSVAGALPSLRHSLTWHMLGARGHILIFVQAHGSWMFRDASFGSDSATGLSGEDLFFHPHRAWGQRKRQLSSLGKCCGA